MNIGYKKAGVGRAFKSYYLTLILVIFFFGFFIGWILNDSSLDETSLFLEKSQLDIKSFNYALLFSEELNISICNSDMIDYMENVLFESSTGLISLESKSKTYSEEYDLLKQKHNINQVLFYTYYKNYFDSCKNSEPIILFFFNSSEPINSQEQGKILNSIVNKQDIRIIAMDYGYTRSLDFFYDFYLTENLPTLVINYDTIKTGLVLEEELDYLFI